MSFVLRVSQQAGGPYRTAEQMEMSSTGHKQDKLAAFYRLPIVFKVHVSTDIKSSVLSVG